MVANWGKGYFLDYSMMYIDIGVTKLIKQAFAIGKNINLSSTLLSDSESRINNRTEVITFYSENY